MKAIQTEYHGLLFRSRIEARWAYVFDLLGIKYEYEKEGYELASGRYLPDFWLPELKMWVEIKGEYPTPQEKRMARNLADGSLHPVIILSYGIPREDGFVDNIIYFGDGGEDSGYKLCECPDCGLIGFEFDGSSDRLPCKSDNGCPRHSSNGGKHRTGWSERLQLAYHLARQARFEHGQSPVPRKIRFQKQELVGIDVWGIPSRSIDSIVNYEEIAF